jgi:hypothetical protein
MADKKSFLLYTDYRQHLELLSDAERGKLLIALFDYAENSSVPELDGIVKMAFSFIKAQMDRDNKKYGSICKRNQQNGAKGGRPKKPKKPSGLFRNPNEPKKADTDNDTDNDIPPISPKGIDERFNTFWKAYPKKVGKGAAEKSFKKYKPDDTLLSAMLKALEVQKRSDQWKKDSGQYIPNPATWLNQMRWEDETTNDDKGGLPILT